MIRTISFPDSSLLSDVGQLPSGLRGVVWNLQDSPEGAEAAEIDAVVLPYGGANSVLRQLGEASNLKLVQAQTTGIDGIYEAVGADVAIASAAGVHAAATAELAIGLVLASLRGIDKAARDMLTTTWDSQRHPSLVDKTVLLLGVGGIGREIAARLRPFDVDLLRVGSTSRNDEFGQIHGVEDLTELTTRADVLIVVTPLTETTYKLIDSTVLAALRDGGLVVNVGRGAVIDSEALTKEVLSGRLRCALDVFDPEPIPPGHPLWTSHNALITPHLGGNTSAFHPRIVKLLRKQIQAISKCQRPDNLVHNGSMYR